MAWIRMGGCGTKLKEWCNLVIGLANVPIREDAGFSKVFGVVLICFTLLNQRQMQINRLCRC